jgi:putative ABC transport system permease protein
VICAGLTLRSLHALTQVEMGFDGARVYSFKTNLTADAYPTAERVEAFYDALTNRLASLPGTTSIGAISYLPLSGEGLSLNAAPDNAPRNGTAEATVFWRLVRGRYFETMGVRVAAGRLFEATDRAGTPPVAVLDELVARRFWGSDAAAIGKRVRVGAGEPRTVVGVVRHVNEVGPGKPSFPIIYAPQAQAYQRGMYTVLRTTGTPASVLASARAALAAVDPAVPLYFAETVDARYDATLALPRFTAGLVSGFSLLALLLAGVGVFGVTAYAVRQRTREFGIRLALGAPLRHIAAIVLGRIGRLATIGLLLGGALAFGLGSLLSGLLFGVENTDVPSALVAIAAIAVMALAAAIVPLRHAAGVRPAEILRAE